MADKKISELNVAGALTGVELTPVVQSGETKKTTLGDIKTYIGAEPADATILKESDVDDTPVDGATTAPISSNWAYDHTADPSAHNPVNGQSDIGADLSDSDTTLVYDDSASSHKKSAISRFWTYIASKLTAYTGDLTAKSFSLNQNITQAAWTTSGVRYKNTPVTLTDTSSSGTVAAAYTNAFGGNTIAASNATTFTEYATTYLSAPTAGTNVTITNPYALSIAGNTKLAGGTVTASAPVLDIAQTWNNAAVAFTGIKANITNTASASASRLLDLQVGGASKCYIDKNGWIYPNVGDYACGGVVLGNHLYITAWDGGLWFNGGASGGYAAFSIRQNNLFIASNGILAWTSGHPMNGYQDLMLCRDAANTLAQRNSTTAQTYRIYNTYTDASNYERAKIEWASNILKIGTEKAGTGTARALELVTDGTTRLTFSTTGLATFSGAVLSRAQVTAVTATATPTATDSATIYTNEGDADGATITLPTAEAGLQFSAIVQAAQTLTITANTGDTIRIGSSVTAAAGSISSAVVGSSITLQAINATEWVALSTVGSWSI